MAKNSEIFIGAVFGRLTVTEVIGVHKGSQSRTWAKTLCACGNIRTVIGYALGKTTLSCGCLNLDNITARNTKHNQYGTRTYRIWIGMCNRARNPTQRAGYVERGMCETWNSFETFLDDLGPCPSDEHTLDRINNEKGYCKDNCRWATYAEQMRNRRNNVIVLYRGSPICLADAAALLGIDQKNLRNKVGDSRRSKASRSIKVALGPEFAWPDGIHFYTKEKDT